MKQTKAPETTPSPKVDKVDNPNSLFISLALDMSWRLAIVVLVPIVGGFELDKKLNLAPLLTIVGFIIAMVGLALVLWRTLQVANKATLNSNSKEKHS